MGKRIAILQSNYIPWKGYFDLINSVDEFIIFDTAQFTKNDWRNRNKIKTSSGVAWLTIPVCHHFGQTILETRVSNSVWSKKHWSSISQNYAKSPYFRKYEHIIENLYHIASNEQYLSKVNNLFIKEICEILDINTPIRWSQDYHLVDGKTERLVYLCQQTRADEYLSGPAAKVYIQEELFSNAGIKLSYMDYSEYPEYHQLFPPFEHGVSVLDLILNEGPEAKFYMKSF
jgi:hypothetical protein